MGRYSGRAVWRQDCRHWRRYRQVCGTNGYTLIRNLASHGIGYGLHDEPGEIPTWPDRSERRRIEDGLVFTVEPFLSMGGQMAEEKSMDDPWTLVSVPSAPCVQYEHTIVATRRGAVVVTLAA